MPPSIYDEVSDEVYDEGASAVAMRPKITLTFVPARPMAVLMMIKNDSMTGQSIVVDAGRHFH